MYFTDIFVKRPVLACVVGLFIFVLGVRSYNLLPIRQFPYTENAVITVTTFYIGADASVVSGYITTPLEKSIAQATGIDYMKSKSTQSTSIIQVFLRLNYDSNKALSDINTKVNAVINELPKEAQLPIVSISIGQTIDSMYLGFYSKVLPNNKITDYLVRVVQPKLQAIPGVQLAEILGGREFAMRIWMDPAKLAGFGLTSADVAKALATNDLVTAVGRTDGNMMTVNFAADTGLTTVEQFRKMIVKAKNGAFIRLQDIGTVSLGATNYDAAVKFSGNSAVYVGVQVTPTANILTVIEEVKKLFPTIVKELPQGLNARIVYDTTEFINSSIDEVVASLIEALVIVSIVIFLFLGSMRSVIIPLIAIPLSLVGTLFIMLILHYSINLLTLLAFVLAIGLVVDDAIIVVENVQRHIEHGMLRVKAALQGARELANPIIAISAVLIAVYLPIGFMGGLTGALFSEFAFTLAAAVTISAIVALTLSPLMCAKFLSASPDNNYRFINYINQQFENLREKYHYVLHNSLNYLNVTVVFACIILTSIYFLYITSQSELAPQEDQGVILAQMTTAPNATLNLTQLYAREINKIAFEFPETDHTFSVDGANGLNTNITGMLLKPWDQRSRTSNQLQPLFQKQLNKISGGLIAAFQLPPLPGSRDLPVQFVIETTENFQQLNEISQIILNKAKDSGLFLFIDTDLKFDKAQANIILNRDKAAELGLTMLDISNFLASALSQNYINYFNYSGRSYQVIPQMIRDQRINASQILNYYITNATGAAIPFSTIATIKTAIVPQTINHFQQLNSATISAVPSPGITLSEALNKLKSITNEVVPHGYTIDYGGESRQFIQESSALIVTFFFALIIIFLSLAALFESFRDPIIVLISVPMSICGALIFISLGVGGASLNIYTEVGLITLIGLISKHGILIVQFANDLQKEGKSKQEAIELAASIRLRPILMTTAAMVFGVIPLLLASGAGAVSRFNIGLVIFTGLSIGTLFTLFVVPAMYMLLATEHKQIDLEFEENNAMKPIKPNENPI